MIRKNKKHMEVSKKKSKVHPFFLPSHQEEISTHTNMLRRSIRVCSDFIKLLSIFFFPVLSPFLKAAKIPIVLSNAALQIIAVNNDKKYPNLYKQTMISALLSILVAASIIWFSFQASIAAFILLTVYTHSIRAVYRTSKLQLAINTHQNLITSNVDKQCIDEETAAKIFSYWLTLKNLEKLDEGNTTDFIYAQNQFNKTLEGWLSKPQTGLLDKVSESKFTIYNQAFGVTLIISRGIVAVLLLTAVFFYPPLIIPLSITSLLINSCDLARDCFSKWQVQKNLGAIDTAKQTIIAHMELNHVEGSSKIPSYQQMLKQLNFKASPTKPQPAKLEKDTIKANIPNSTLINKPAIPQKIPPTYNNTITGPT